MYIPRYNDGIIIGEENGCRMITQIVDELQYLIRNWINFNADFPLLNDLQQMRVFNNTIAMTDSLRAEYHGINLLKQVSELLK